MENTKECWSSLEKTAEHIGVNKDTIRNWIEKGVIPAYKVGKQWKFKISEIDEWIRSGESAKIVE
ncbi:MAG: helix-turn-helix domain-containing protein [Spirochaetaceae bacterium]|jgi:excisionase family DNA binding protein|nr:helix-turn-helix domain-containing protein [Spirochaetaceae bacterium]